MGKLAEFIVLTVTWRKDMTTLPKNPSASDCSRYMTPVGEMMTKNPFSINDTATARVAAAFLLEKNSDAAPVINEAGRPIGVISVADIVRYEQGHGDVPAPRSSVRVKEIMNRELFFVSPNKPVGEVIEALLSSGFARLYVIDDNTVLIGVVSRRDLLRYIHAGREDSMRLPARPMPRIRRSTTPVAHRSTFLRKPRAETKVPSHGYP